MEVHNTVEDTVISRVNEVFSVLKTETNLYGFCACDQCRMDTICYVLNRTPPHYISSHRGATRARWETIERQQQIADITTLIHEGLKRVNHTQRPSCYGSAGETDKLGADSANPVFNIPTIMGRLFNGGNFAPVLDASVELLRNGELVAMKDGNWQNPYRLVHHTAGTFSFWPATVKASAIDERATFEYSLRISAPELEPMVHFFSVPVASEVQETVPFALNRTFKLPDLYMFPPGETEQNRCLCLDDSN